MKNIILPTEIKIILIIILLFSTHCINGQVNLSNQENIKIAAKADSLIKIDEFSKAIKIGGILLEKGSKENNKLALGLAYNIIGTVYSASGNLDAGETNFKKGIEVFSLIKDSVRTIRLIGNLGIIYNKKKQFKKRDSILNLAIKETKKTKSSNYFDIQITYVKYMFEHKNYKELIKRADEYIYLLKKGHFKKEANHKDTYYNSYGLNTIKAYKAFALIELGEHEKGHEILVEIKKFLEESNELNAKKRYAVYSYYKAIYYLKTDKNKDSIYYYMNQMLDKQNEAYKKFKEQYRNTSFALKQVEIKAISDKKNDDIASKEVQIRIIFLILTILFMTTLLAIFLLNTKSKQTKVIEAQKEIIESNLDQKNLLLNELHHRVKNNLQTIVSLLNLQEKNMTATNSETIFKDSVSRIRVFSKIHHQLYENEDLTKIKLCEYITSLSSDIHKVYNINKKVFLNLNLDKNIYSNIDDAISIGLIINELITNSFKHAIKSDYEDTIFIDIKKKLNTVTFYYKDSGRPFNIEDLLNNKTNKLGVNLINRLANQLGTDANFDSKNGLKVWFKFKINRKE